MKQIDQWFGLFNVVRHGTKYCVIESKSTHYCKYVKATILKTEKGLKVIFNKVDRDHCDQPRNWGVAYPDCFKKTEKTEHTIKKQLGKLIQTIPESELFKPIL